MSPGIFTQQLQRINCTIWSETWTLLTTAEELARRLNVHITTSVLRILRQQRYESDQYATIKTGLGLGAITLPPALERRTKPCQTGRHLRTNISTGQTQGGLLRWHIKRLIKYLVRYMDHQRPYQMQLPQPLLPISTGLLH